MLSLPYWEIPQKDLLAITNYAKRKSESLYEVLQHIESIGVGEKTVKIAKKFVSLIEKHTSLAKEYGITRIVFAFLDDFNYLKYLKKLPEQKSREAFSFLNQFYREVREFETASIDKSAKAFLEELDYVMESGDRGALTPDWEAGPESVKVMTIHAAKGLEFKYVFVVSMVDKRFPTIERNDPIELPEKLVKDILPEGDIHLQEERRLFYVAMTRSKRELYFTRAEDYGGARKKKPSRFLHEMGLISPSTPSRQARGRSGSVGKKQQTKKSLDARQKSVKPVKEGSVIYKDTIPARFSFTQLKAFETCPYQYKFAHILKIPIQGRAVFSFGKTIHRTMEKFFSLVIERAGSVQKDLFGGKEVKSEKGKEVAVQFEELMNIYEDSWIDDWFDSKKHEAEYKKKGSESLKVFYEQIKNDIPVPKYLEQYFNIRMGDYTVIGVIDRADEIKKGELEIIDYKTGRPKSEKKMYPEDKEQLLIYQIGVKQVFEEKPVQLSYYYIDNNTKVSFIGKDDELKKLEEKIVGIIEDIGKSDFPAKPEKMKCSFCDFKEICEYRVL